MKKKLIILLCCLVFSINLFSQEYCEVDKVFSSFDREIGCGIIQTSNGNFITLSISGQNGPMKVNIPKFALTKLDRCGNVIWRYTYDYCYNCSAGTSILMEDDDGSIIFGGYLSSNNQDTLRKNLRLYKTSSSGQLIWSKQFGDSTKKYVLGGSKISNNRYLFVGYYYGSNPGTYYPIALIIDTLGNTLYQEPFPTQEGGFFSAVKQNSNKLLILGKQGLNFVMLNIDTNGNTIDKKTISRLRGMEPYILTVNKDLTRLIYMARNGAGQTLLAHLDMNGNLIKDSLFNIDFIAIPNSLHFSHLTKNNGILFSGVKIMLVDSNFHLKLVDENKDSIGIAYSNLITENETLVSTGKGNGRPDGVSYNIVYDYWFSAKSISTTAKAINIFGGTLINKKHDTIQLYVSILPATTINKMVFWEVNDTNLATITQTGILTAKANGVVTVTATSTDGSNLSAQKVITISNQTVGMEVNAQWLQNIKIYPNPAVDYFELDFLGSGLETIEILNVNGIIVYAINASNCTEPCNFSTIDFNSGIYFIRINTTQGSVVKKFAVLR